MKSANDPNRQQPTTPVRPAAPTVVRTTSSTTHSVVTTNVTSHIVSTGNPALPCVKTIPVTASRVLPHTSTTTLTLVGSGTSTLRPVTTSPAITSFHVAKAPTATSLSIAGPRGALSSTGVRAVMSSPGISTAGQGTTANFVPGIRAMTRPAGSLTAVTTVPAGWGGGLAGKPGATTPTKISAQPGPRAAASSLTVTTRPMTAQTRPELATVRTTKPVAASDKFGRAPARAALGFSPSPGQAGQLQGSPLTHLAVTALPTGQPSPGLTLQPVVVGTAGSTPKSVVTARHTALHPIGPKVITQPAHGIQITHLAGVAGKPGCPGALQIARGPAPQAQAGTPFASAPGGTQVKVLAPQGAGALLSDVLSQQPGTTLIPPGSVFIQATQHVSQLERGTVVTSAGYTLPGGSYFYEANASGGSLIAAGPAHQQHQLIRTFAPTVTQGGVAVQVQASSFTSSDERKPFSGSVATSAGNMSAGRFNPVMVAVAPNPASQQEGSSDLHSGQQHQQQLQQSGPSSHSSSSGAQLPTQTSHQQPQPPSQQQGASAPPVLASSSQQGQGGPNQVGTAQGVSNLLPSTPTTTPSKFSASPRPSILRKREHDGTPSKAQKNLSAMLAAMSSSPPPSPPTRPDSRDGKDHQGGNSSAGSSTISATSSPGLPCDGDNNGGSQCSLTVKSELVELADAANSNNGTNGNSDAMSPRKKPRKQQLTGNELQEPPYSDENAEFAEDKVKKEGQEGNHKAPDGSPGTPGRGAAAAVPTRRRPSVSLLQAYRSCWKPRNNHFLRPADVRPREERRPTVAELSSQKRVVQRAKGWKLHHLSTQMEEMAEREADVLGQLSEVLDEMEQPRPGHEPGRDLNRTSELIRSNLQRSKVVRDQLDECRSQLLRLLDHTSPVIDIIKRNANRRQAKKKY